MKRFSFRQVVFRALLPLAVVWVPTGSDAAENRGDGRDATAIADREPRHAKSDRLRFRPAGGSCACTCAKGGMRESEIKQAEETRARTGD